MRRLSKTKNLGLGIAGVLLFGLVLSAPAQTSTAPKATAPKPAPAPMHSTRTPIAPPKAPMAPASNQPSKQRVVIVEPIRVFDPFFDYPYPYAYPPDYMAENFGYVKIDTNHKDDSVYVDGGFADKVEKAKKFALRPGTHEIELRDSDGRNVFEQRVAVIVGKTTTLHIG